MLIKILFSIKSNKICRSMICWITSWLVGWLAGWLARGRAIGLVGCWLVGWLVGWLVYKVFGHILNICMNAIAVEQKSVHAQTDTKIHKQKSEYKVHQ